LEEGVIQRDGLSV